MTAQRSLFALPAPESLPDGVFFLPNALTDAVLEDVVRALKAVVVAAPPQRTQTRGGGMTSAAMTNCGNAGWWSDRRGYRYLTRRPDTGGAMAGDARCIQPGGARDCSTNAVGGLYARSVPDQFL